MMALRVCESQRLWRPPMQVNGLSVTRSLAQSPFSEAQCMHVLLLRGTDPRSTRAVSFQAMPSSALATYFQWIEIDACSNWKKETTQ